MICCFASQLRFLVHWLSCLLDQEAAVVVIDAVGPDRRRIDEIVPELAPDHRREGTFKLFFSRANQTVELIRLLNLSDTRYNWLKLGSIMVSLVAACWAD